MGAVFIFLAILRNFETEKLGIIIFVSSEKLNNFATFFVKFSQNFNRTKMKKKCSMGVPFYQLYPNWVCPVRASLAEPNVVSKYIIANSHIWWSSCMLVI